MAEPTPDPNPRLKSETSLGTSHLPEPLQGDIRRQAVPSIEGMVYQAWWSIDAWLQLSSPDEIIYLEGAEDFDVLKPGSTVTVQVKKLDSSISLNNARAHEALDNFWELSWRESTRHIHFHYLTTSAIASEQDSNFQGLKGIEAWRAAQTNLELVVTIAVYLKKKLPKKSSLRAFVATATPNDIQERLIRRFHWLTQQPDIETVKRSVNDRICALLFNTGRSVSLSKAVQKYLAYHFWETVVKASPSDRCLTHGELIRQIEAATTTYIPVPNDKLLDIISNSDPGLNLFNLLIQKSPLPPNPLLQRPPLVQYLENIVLQRRVVLLTGSIYKGKTTLAQLVASKLCPEAWWIKLTELKPTQVDTLFLTLATKIESGDCPSLVIIDDMDVSPLAHRVYRESLSLVLHRANAVGRGVILTAQGATSESAIIQDFSNIDLLDVPPICSEETTMLCQQHGCPQSISSMWGELVHLLTRGHPALVQVRISELMTRGWPNPNPSDLIPSAAMLSIRQRARHLLSESVSSSITELVYLISECSVLMRRNVAIRLAESIDGITNAGDTLDKLTGKWLEQIDDKWLRSSALLKGVANEVWSPERLRQAHIQIHDAIRKEGTLEPSEAAALFFHAFVARDKNRLTHTAIRLQTLKDSDAKHEAERQLMWLASVALESGQSIIDDPTADVFIRQLQFRVASTLDSDNLPQILDRWAEDIGRIQIAQAREVMYAVMWSSCGLSQNLKVPLKLRLQSIAGIGTLSEELQRFQTQNIRSTLENPDSIKAGIPATATLAQLFFLHSNRSVRNVESLNELLRWLDNEATQELRQQFDDMLEWPVMQALGAFIQGAWAAQHEATHDWAPWLSLLEQFYEYAKRQHSPRLGREAAKAKAIILTEYLEGGSDAIQVLDQASSDFGSSAVLLEQRANVLYHKQDDVAVLEIWGKLTSDPTMRSLLDPFSYRRAGISSARLKRWDDAERIFLDAAGPLTSSIFAPTKFGLQVDAALVVALRGDCPRASRMLAEATLTLPPESACEGDLDWDAVQRVAVEVCRTIEKLHRKQENLELKVKVGDGSSPTLRPPKLEPGQKCRNELTRIQALHLAATLNPSLPSIVSEVQILADSKFVHVRWYASEARLAISYSNGAGTGFIEALIAFERAYADLGRKRATLTLQDALNPDEGPPSDLTLVPEQWFGLLVAGIICGGNSLLTNLNIWLDESRLILGIDAPLTEIVKLLIHGASSPEDSLKSVLQDTRNPAPVRCGAAAKMLCTCLSAETTLDLQLLLTSALGINQSWIVQELYNLHVARCFANMWRTHAENRFQFSNPRTTVPALLLEIDKIVTGVGTLKSLFQAAARAIDRPIPGFMERIF